jgi:hypothetical protein
MIDPARILMSTYRWWGNIDTFFDAVKHIGYPYFEWNGKIYQINYPENSYFDTGFTI